MEEGCGRRVLAGPRGSELMLRTSNNVAVLADTEAIDVSINEFPPLGYGQGAQNRPKRGNRKPGPERQCKGCKIHVVGDIHERRCFS